MNEPHTPPANDGLPRPEPLATIRAALDRIKFGAIHLTVHDGKLVQLDITEKTRFPA